MLRKSTGEKHNNIWYTAICVGYSYNTTCFLEHFSQCSSTRNGSDIILLHSYNGPVRQSSVGLILDFYYHHKMVVTGDCQSSESYYQNLEICSKA